MVGSHHLHKNVAIMLAGNKDNDGAIVHPMSTALQSRLVHLELVVDAKEWDDWAVSEGNIDHRITSYIKYKPGNLYTFSAEHTDDTYACPRTWEFASRILKVSDDNPGSSDLLALLAGTLSEGVAREFISFCKIHQDLLKIDQIIAAPKSVKVPDQPSVLFALTGSIAHNINLENGTPLLEFVNRLPVEFQVVCLREAVRRNKAMLKHAAIQKWVADTGKDHF